LLLSHFIVLETHQRLCDPQRNFEDVVNASSVPTCRALSLLHFKSDRREALRRVSFDRKPFWAVLAFV
jgi:hypothetical protein